MDKDLKNKTAGELEKIVSDFGEKKYLAGYIFSSIHAKNISEVCEVSTLSKKFRQKLDEEGFYISRLETIEKLVDPDGTVKYLFELGDGVRIESVLLTDGERKTLCISCQGGCRMGCVFCATGQLKFSRNLSGGEIADEINQVTADCGKINNVVYMGMGEPMDNYDEVMRSVRILNDAGGMNIGQRHITISTCGLVDGIGRFADEGLQVRLAISLHGARDDVRGKIMAVAKKYPVAKVIEAVKDYQQKTGRRVTFEYCMIKGLNDSVSDARGVVKLIGSMKANVNLIEYNRHEGCEFIPSSKNQINPNLPRKHLTQPQSSQVTCRQSANHDRRRLQTRIAAYCRDHRNKSRSRYKNHRIMCLKEHHHYSSYRCAEQTRQ